MSLPSPITLSNFIDNQFIPPSTFKYISSPNPATGTINALVPDSAAADVDAAVAAAKSAFPTWSTTTRSERSAILSRIANLLESRLEEFAQQESYDQGLNPHVIHIAF